MLVLHGFTGSPHSMRPLAECLANRGYSVELPLLPGHGTALEDLVPTRWSDWSAGRRGAPTTCSRRGAAASRSSGCRWAAGSRCWLAEHRPEVAALVVVNPLVEPDRRRAARRGATRCSTPASRRSTASANDIAKLEGVDERGYDGAADRRGHEPHGRPRGGRGVARVDHLPDARAHEPRGPRRHDGQLRARGRRRPSGPVEHVWLERSYHVATLDHDAALIEAETGRFLEAAFASA